MKSYTLEQLSPLRQRHDRWLRAQPGVVGTGIGLNAAGEVCIKVFSNRLAAATRTAIYDRLRGLPVAVEEVGEIRKQSG